jgi:hypothetical protein
MREDGVEDLLKRAGGSWDSIRKLIEQEQLIQTEYRGKRFYSRKLHG